MKGCNRVGCQIRRVGGVEWSEREAGDKKSGILSWVGSKQKLPRPKKCWSPPATTCIIPSQLLGRVLSFFFHHFLSLQTFSKYLKFVAILRFFHFCIFYKEPRTTISLNLSRILLAGMAEAISPPPGEPSAASNGTAHVQGLKDNTVGGKVSVGPFAQLRFSHKADLAVSVVFSVFDQLSNRTLTNGSAAQSAMSSAQNSQTVQSLSSGEVRHIRRLHTSRLKS